MTHWPVNLWATLALLAGPVTCADAAYSFPLKVSGNGRHFVDQAGVPFLVQGDAAWSLIVQLTAAEAEQYLEDRRQKGFNLVMVNLIEHAYCDNPPFNRNGDAPFTTPGGFSTPNEAYFAFADQIIAIAAQKGIVVLLAPAYLGYNGGWEGWYQEMEASGAVVLRDYGRYVGQRYRSFDNIIWMNGGDYNPADAQLVLAVAEGIAEEDERHLQTAHCAPETSALDLYAGEPWLHFNTTYSYSHPLYEETLEDFTRPDFKAFIMVESRYENEADWSPQRMRRQAYWSNLTGACGQIFGNRPIWLFDAGWQAAMNSQGSRDMQHLGTLFAPLRWPELDPDQNHEMVTSGWGTLGLTDYVTAAATPDGTLGVAYIPATGTGSRTLTVDLARFSGPVTARWFNPTNANYTLVVGSPFANAGLRDFTSPGDNGTGTNDWVLLLEVPAAPVPAASTWGITVLTLLLAIAATTFIHRRCRMGQWPREMETGE